MTGCNVNKEDFGVALHPPQVMVPVGDPGVEHCTCHPGCFVMVVLNSHVCNSDMISENVYKHLGPDISSFLNTKNFLNLCWNWK